VDGMNGDPAENAKRSELGAVIIFFW
jgi:hypothetical protein